MRGTKVPQNHPPPDLGKIGLKNIATQGSRTDMCFLVGHTQFLNPPFDVSLVTFSNPDLNLSCIDHRLRYIYSLFMVVFEGHIILLEIYKIYIYAASTQIPWYLMQSRKA